MKSKEILLTGQKRLFELPTDLESAAQRYAAQIIQTKKCTEPEESVASNESDYHQVDINSLELSRPRSIGAEHVCYEGLRQLQIDVMLKEFGLNNPEIYASIGNIIGRMIKPGSELATYHWLQHQSGVDSQFILT